MNRIKSFIGSVARILRFNQNQRTSKLISNSLNIDSLAFQHGVTSERVGRFLEAELAWVYQVQIVLTSFDFSLEISEIDRLHDYSALCLFVDKTGKKRLITSNPDLIMSATHEYKALQRSGAEFQLANMAVLEATLIRIKMVKNVLDVMPDEQKFTFSLFLLSFLDCLDLGATEVEYLEGRYVATSKDAKYEGVVSREVVRVVKGMLANEFILPLEILFKELGIVDGVSYVVKGEGFIVGIGRGKKVVTESKEFKHILLVDDDHRFVDLLKRGISLKGFRVSVASSAKQAIEYLNTSGVKVDLVVSDFYMPNFSGASLIASIREVDLNMPIIGLTGDTHVDSQISFISAGANAIVRKSDDPKVLLAWIYKLLNEELQLKVA